MSAARLAVPRAGLVLLIGPAGSGKSTFAARRFRRTEILSSDGFRALVSDREDNQRATDDAFEVLHLIADKRLERNRLCVVDATNVTARGRAPLLALAHRHRLPAAAIVLYLPLQVCEQRNETRTRRRVPTDAVQRQWEQMRLSLTSLPAEGLDPVYLLTSPAAVDAAKIRWVKR